MTPFDRPSFCPRLIRVYAAHTTLLFAFGTATCSAAAQIDAESSTPPEHSEPAAAPEAEETTVISFGSETEEELISDPELSEVPTEQVEATTITTGTTATPLPTRPTADLRVSLHTRLAVDTSFDDDYEDVFEALQLASFDARIRRSENLKFAVGLRARWVGATRRNGSAPGGRDRYELDLVPTAGNVDATVHDGIHLRIGWQGVPLGRFDSFGATNFLAAYDLRSGPLMPPPAEIGQLAARIDIVPNTWFDLSAIYVPFFQPHLIAITGSDWALFALAEQEARAGGVDDASRIVEDALQRSGTSALSAQSFRALGPEPGFDAPQGALRATARGTAGEGSLTLGTALEHVPALIISPELEAFIENPGAAETAALLSSTRPLDVEYGRYGIVSTDGALDVGPIQLGAEAAYMVNRTLVATATGTTPRVGTTDMVHVAGRFEFVSGRTWIVGAEGFFSYALDDPRNPAQAWIAMRDGSWWSGGGGLVRWSPGGGPVALEMGGIGFVGPSWLVAPRIEWQVVEPLFLELGAFVLGGPAPGPFGTPNVSVAGIYDDEDLVFVGMKWLP